MRTAIINRKTKETDIVLKINLDGQGKSKINVPSGFLKHMLETLAKHSFMDLEIKATGDIDVDFHHIVEDLGICLGQAFNKALGNKIGINRFGSVIVPMDEALTMCAIDICGRSACKYNVKIKNCKINEFDTEVLKEFFKAFSDNAKVNLHIMNYYGSNAHHIVESVFKAFSRAIKEAKAIDKNIKGVLSTKNVL